MLPCPKGSFCGKARFFATFPQKSLDKSPSLCYNHPIQSVTNRKKYAEATISRETAVAVSSQSGRLNTFGQLRTEPASAAVGCVGRARYRAGVSSVLRKVTLVKG